MAVVTIRQLLDSGVHFGHQTRRWNPKMKRFILTERSGSHIIDLQQSLAYIDKTYDYVRETVAHGGTILFVGTKKQAQGSIAEQAQRVGQPFVNQRWLGGLLTNFQTVSKRLARMKELEELDFDDTTKGFTKKELLIKKRELTKLHKSLGGIRNLTKTPSALWVVDTKKEHLAIDEAHKLGIPVIGILDTNCDPDEVQYPIPGNDDAIRSVALLTRIVADAAAEGLIQRHQKSEGDGEAAEPMAEWEAELLQAGAPSTPAPDADAAAAPAEVVESAVTAAAPAEPAEAPATEAPIAEAPAAEAPVADDAPVEKAVAKAPVAKAPAAKKPAAKTEATKAEPTMTEATEAEPAKAPAKPAAKKPAAKADAADDTK
ncbi:small subunit ribosomal protein S2 [Cryobacterium mesophilum]|uniref:Small ribosomal subunit protein uS2 n=1 Tax=Terrimesophilobacter mesophilus TaxID=433647 RepID=A0A4R8VAD4_9MICO|nr:30S ribosomal protein S2 [Terrimesophilobacter mesophilus]MBB5632480.1 small subunit ribosomal protein S2 [Terrimesophilobacter mesophilus]TFB79306.1 30S ribosomal protein S2 [Terrimesophilobacter mesophilus]